MIDFTGAEIMPRKDRNLFIHFLLSGKGNDFRQK